MYEVDIKVIELPVSVRGVTAMRDGTYYIFINSIYDINIRNEILLEELMNIEEFAPKDFEKLKFDERNSAD